MNKILIFFIIFFFNFSVFADDIKDFDIDGISIGESLLNHSSKNLIESKNKNLYPNSDEYYAIEFNSNELKLTLEYFGLTVEMNAFKELKQLILAVQKYVRKNIETFETLDLNPVVIDNNHRAVALDALLTTARI